MTTKLEQDLKALLENKEVPTLLEEIKKKLEDAPSEIIEEKKEESNEPPVSIENPIDPAIVNNDDITKDPNKPVDGDVSESVTPQEPLEALVSEEFSEDFKSKATALFESILLERQSELRKELEEDCDKTILQVKESMINTHAEEVKKLTESFEEKMTEQNAIFEERIAEMEKSLSDKIDGYVGQVAEQWMKDNEVAVESGIKVELAESFISGIKNVFETHGIDLPEIDHSKLSELQESKSSLESKVAEFESELQEAKKELFGLRKEKLIAESTKDLTEIDKTKFTSMMEEFVFENEEAVIEKMNSIKESFFGQGKRNHVSAEFAKPQVKTIVESQSDFSEISATMKSYLKAL
jgi:hypothetical protein